MKQGMDIYNSPRRIVSAVKSLQNADISEKNKQLVLKFRDYASVEGIGVSRTARYLESLKVWAILLEKDFDKADINDIREAVRKLHEMESYSPRTKSGYKIMLKRFYKWLKETGDDYPEEVKWIKTRLGLTEKRLPGNGELIIEQEVEKLIKAATHPRNKALVSVLYESGARAGEIGSLQIKNVKFDNYGTVIYVEGKTGSRPIRLVASTPYLATWIQNHPFKDNKEAPLWVNLGSLKQHKMLCYAGIATVLRNLFKKAGVNKKYNPHLFRHSRATFLADHLTEFQMNQYFGWIQGSKMPSTYVHMSGKKIDQSILALNGVKSPEASKESVIKPKMCPRCDTINSNDAKFCCKCAGILDIKTAFELEKVKYEETEMRKNTDQIMELLMKNPESKAVIMEQIDKLGLSDKIGTA